MALMPPKKTTPRKPWSRAKFVLWRPLSTWTTQLRVSWKCTPSLVDTLLALALVFCTVAHLVYVLFPPVSLDLSWCMTFIILLPFVFLPFTDFTPLVDVVRRSNKHSHNEVISWHVWVSYAENVLFQSIIKTIGYLWMTRNRTYYQLNSPSPRTVKWNEWIGKIL